MKTFKQGQATDALRRLSVIAVANLSESLLDSCGAVMEPLWQAVTVMELVNDPDVRRALVLHVQTGVPFHSLSEADKDTLFGFLRKIGRMLNGSDIKVL